MKKGILLVGIIILCFMITGCGEKEKAVKNNKDFVAVAKKLGFETKDVTKEQTDAQKEMLDSVYIAFKDDFQIEFYKFKTLDIAKTAFFNGEKKFDNGNSNNYVENIDHGKNYGYFYLDIKSRYGVVSRVGKTLLLADTTRDNREEVQKFVREMGY